MNHLATPGFWYWYRQLPEHVRDVADKNFDLLRNNLHHPSLRFKKIGELWTVRVGRGFRALAHSREEGMVWFWIGDHAAYERMLQQE